MPRSLQEVIGKGELWRSLETDSFSLATRRIHRLAAYVEAEFERARATLGCTVDPTLVRPWNDGLPAPSLADEVAKHLRVTLQPSPAAQPAADTKTIAEVYELYCADPRHAWSKRTEGAYATTRRWVLDVFGSNTPVTAITREKCREFLNLLLRLPAHADRRYRGLSIRQAVKAAEGKKVRIIQRSDIHRMRGRLVWLRETWLGPPATGQILGAFDRPLLGDEAQ